MTLEDFKKWLKTTSEETLLIAKKAWGKNADKDNRIVIGLCLDEIDCEIKVRRPVAQGTLKLTDDKLLKELFLV